MTRLTFFQSAPLLSNILPHLQALAVFITNTLPKPVLVALLYRLVVLHFASQILPAIGADSWETEAGVDHGWDERPVSSSISIASPILKSDVFTDVQAHAPSLDLPTINIRDGIFPFTT